MMQWHELLSGSYAMQPLKILLLLREERAERALSIKICPRCRLRRAYDWRPITLRKIAHRVPSSMPPEDESGRSPICRVCGWAIALIHGGLTDIRKNLNAGQTSW